MVWSKNRFPWAGLTQEEYSVAQQKQATKLLFGSFLPEKEGKIFLTGEISYNYQKKTIYYNGKITLSLKKTIFLKYPNKVGARPAASD